MDARATTSVQPCTHSGLLCATVVKVVDKVHVLDKANSSGLEEVVPSSNASCASASQASYGSSTPSQRESVCVCARVCVRVCVSECEKGAHIHTHTHAHAHTNTNTRVLSPPCRASQPDQHPLETRRSGAFAVRMRAQDKNKGSVEKLYFLLKVQPASWHAEANPFRFLVHTDTQTHRHTDTDTQTHRHTDTQTYTHTHRCVHAKC